MKNNSALARHRAICLLMMLAGLMQAGRAVAGPTPSPTDGVHVSGGPPAVTLWTITAKTAPSTAEGSVLGAGSYYNNTTATLTASASNECYVFKDWTGAGKPITNNPYIFTVTKNETLTANFALLDYTISTGSSPANAGILAGGGVKGCGTSAMLRATAKLGFKFANWTSSEGLTITNNPYKFTVSGNDSFVAHFQDVEKPELKILAPGANEKIPSVGFIIEGAVTDNVGVAAVYDNLNGAGWQAALRLNPEFWYTYVTLKPNSANTVSAYAVDTSGNVSATNTVNFICTAAGLAPLSMAGQLAQFAYGTNTSNASFVSFDSAAYVKYATFTNNGSEVGTYTYTPTGPNTAELVPLPVLPTQNTGSNDSALELTFTDAYDAIVTNSSGGTGTVFISPTEESVPATLDGFVIILTNFTSGYSATNSFDSASFGVEDNHGGDYAGTYTFTPFTQVDALLVQTYTSPPSMAGKSNYLILMFSEGVSPPSGYYSSAILDATGVVSLDTGTFTTTSNKVMAKFVAPVTVSGLQASITPTGFPLLKYERSFGKGTFASFSTVTNEPDDVGIRLGNDRITANTGLATFISLGPPFAVGQAEVGSLWKSATAALSTNLNTGKTATVIYSAARNNAPVALTGRTIKAMVTGKTTKSVLTFTNNIFTDIGGSVGSSGTYTYAPYTPTMALVQLTPAGAHGTGADEYVLLNFISTLGGAFVSAKPDAGVPGGWDFSKGSFTIGVTP